MRFSWRNLLKPRHSSPVGTHTPPTPADIKGPDPPASTPPSTSTRSPPGEVFRVTSIPLETPPEDLHAALSIFPTLLPQHTTLCLSPDRRSLTALIHFSSLPDDLSPLRRGDIHILELSTNGPEIAIDRDFYGLTQLYQTEGDIHADIIAVCGLNGHAYGSWAGPTDGRGERKMWLRHFLAHDLPGCRTMIYGYDSSLSPDSRGIQRIPDYTDSFLEEVKKARSSEQEKERMLVYLGHSFGGIIVAQALVKAKESESTHGSLFRRTQAAMFFGTPHRGLLVDDILEMIGTSSNRVALVQSLETGSEELAAELKRFINYAYDAKIKIVNFKETEQTQKVKEGPDGRWTRSGDYHTAVSAASAVLQLPEAMECSLGVDGGNHSTMVKFKHKGHSTYKSVVRFLEDFTRDSYQTDASPISAYKAVKNKDPAALKLALKHHRVDVDKLQEGRTYLLHLAISHGDKPCTLVLLTQGAHTSAVDLDGNTPLHLAVRLGHIWAIDILLDHGTGINTMNNLGMTTLHSAALAGDEKMAGLLLDRGMSVAYAAEDKDGWPALHFAVKGGHVGMVELLLQRGADLAGVGLDGDTPLHVASWEGQEQVLDLLLNKGADITAVDGTQCTALHLAAFRGNAGVLKFLLHRGANKMAKDSSRRTILHHAALGGHVEVVRILLDAGMDITDVTENGHTALHVAARNGRREVVEFLLRRITDKDLMAFDIVGDTPLDLAKKGGHTGVVEALAAHKVEQEVAGDSGIEEDSDQLC